MTWVVVLAVGAGSFVFRLAPLLVGQRTASAPRADRVIRHAGTAAITALIALSTRQGAHGDATLPTLVAVAVSVALAARGASMVRLLVAGGGVYAASVVAVSLVAG